MQLDIADGTLTSQSAWANPLELSQLKWAGEFELHLMQSRSAVSNWLKDDRVTRCIVHAEIDCPDQLLQQIRAQGRLAGLALNPQTPVSSAANLVNLVDYFVLLAVEPGAQGQPFIPDVLPKINEIKKINNGCPVYVDGGVNNVTIKQIKDAGADGVVVGSFLWNSQDLNKVIKELRSA